VTRADGTTRTLHPQIPHHVVCCTGHAGEPRIPSFPGQEKFVGLVQNASQHRDASTTGIAAGKKVLVVGTGNSGHDIALNYYENGAEVTTIQRRGTYVMSAKKGLLMLHEGMYEEGGPPIEDADIAGQSLPIPVQFALNVESTKRITAAEKANLDGLEKADFKLDFGIDKSGIYRQYITRGSSYYIDVGCSQLIIDGKIKVQQSPDGISHFDKKHIILADGTALEADVVIMATGYDNMRTTVRHVFGAAVANRC
jgi:cation diffusion facilitator CzcD-associated flavoprotein CzcO